MGYAGGKTHMALLPGHLAVVAVPTALNALSRLRTPSLQSGPILQAGDAVVFVADVTETYLMQQPRTLASAEQWALVVSLGLGPGVVRLDRLMGS